MPGDIPLDDIAEVVQEAREAILRTISEDPDHAWHPRELMSASKGRLSNTASNTAVSIAFWSLVESGELEVDQQLVVRAVQLH
jgi:hypothetical protein